MNSGVQQKCKLYFYSLGVTKNNYAFGNKKIDITYAKSKNSIFKKKFVFLSSIIFRQLQKSVQAELASCQTSERGWAVDIRGACDVILVERCNEWSICARKSVHLGSWGFLASWHQLQTDLDLTWITNTLALRQKERENSLWTPWKHSPSSPKMSWCFSAFWNMCLSRLHLMSSRSCQHLFV